VFLLPFTLVPALGTRASRKNKATLQAVQEESQYSKGRMQECRQSLEVGWLQSVPPAGSAMQCQRKPLDTVM
jgi:hypothetical protein